VLSESELDAVRADDDLRSAEVNFLRIVAECAAGIRHGATQVDGARDAFMSALQRRTVARDPAHLSVALHLYAPEPGDPQSRFEVACPGYERFPVERSALGWDVNGPAVTNADRVWFDNRGTANVGVRAVSIGDGDRVLFPVTVRELYYTVGQESVQFFPGGTLSFNRGGLGVTALRKDAEAEAALRDLFHRSPARCDLCGDTGVSEVRSNTGHWKLCTPCRTVRFEFFTEPDDRGRRHFSIAWRADFSHDESGAPYPEGDPGPHVRERGQHFFSDPAHYAALYRRMGYVVVDKGGPR